MRTEAMLWVCLFSYVTITIFCTAYGEPTPSVARTEYLRRLNEATLRTIESPDGDVVHCVDRAKQPAFDHPLLSDHVLQESPTSIPEGLEDLNAKYLSMLENSNSTARPSTIFGTQLWHSQGRCPEDTVPIRRPSDSDLLDRQHQTRSYRRLNYTASSKRNLSRKLMGNFAVPVHEYAVGQIDHTSIYGTYAIFNAWNPKVQDPEEMSIAQLWLISGSFYGPYLDTVEAGWTVEPDAYKDYNTRFFIYWTNDNYKTSGCRDLHCPGFVHVSRDMLLGGTISPLSKYGGQQFEMQPVAVWKDNVTGNWWLRVGSTNIGYWPARLFKNGLQNKASIAQWGGEITNMFAKGRHTSTQMGSGHFSTEGGGNAAYVRSLQYVDSTYSFVSVPKNFRFAASNPTCYSITPYSTTYSGTSFFFGGPGYNPQCH
ncbi:hypothetical protein KP509_07G040000 [Ceratopteris richardii]|uniref:Neprosin PEP catalytic domain-containing protein n=1 Tax=Ceratopteris richardii TaxID=49495 RepID=A0A8T2UH07_CERRI|nr:hypothetical protein KP509_07G040000 [Ceratopteris richardii]